MKKVYEAKKGLCGLWFFGFLGFFFGLGCYVFYWFRPWLARTIIFATPVLVFVYR